MKLYHKNPRQITEKQFNDLDEWLFELGDLSGIVHDLNSDEVIGGNQRSRVFDINKCEIVLTEELEEPDEQGTVAHGYIIWKGKKYAYRQVRWDDKQCEKANIVSNKGGGSMDFDILANEFDVDDLLDWGFKSYEIGMISDDDYTTPNLDEWEEPETSSRLIIGFDNDQQKELFINHLGLEVGPKTARIYFKDTNLYDG